MATILYVRIGSSEQALEQQKAEAEQAGFEIGEIVADDGASSFGTRLAERPEGRRLYDMLQAGDVLVVRWLDRLGRNYTDVATTLRAFMGRGVIIKTLINQLTFDGATTDRVQMAVRDALLAFMAASAQAQAAATKQAQRAGIAHAKQRGARAYLGRKPSYTRDAFDMVRDLLEQGGSVARIAKNTGLSRQTVYRIRDDAAGCEKALATWNERRQADLEPIAAMLAKLAKGQR
jgi:putative DNA-invertase from lambdoid prophage Rac